MIDLLLINKTSHRLPRKFINQWFVLIEKELQRRRILSVKSKSLTVVFLPKAAAKKINLQFRGKDYATDVLSFVSEDKDSWGELILCTDVIRRQAKEHGLTLQQELGYMLLHGFLHLLGYEHEKSPKQAVIMFALQDDIFNKLMG
ncbi:MAG: rRNA maturation RNase YbeY [Pseudobdellovibrionaceae bacterium]